MESQSGRADPDLIERLRTESRRFEFVQAAILLKRLDRGGEAERGFRYSGASTLSFPSAEVVFQVPTDDTDRPTLRTLFFGFIGTMGVLPAHYTELIDSRRAIGDRTLQRFLELFHDRLADLFLGAHLRNRYWHRFAWLDGLPSLDANRRSHPFQESILALIGTASGDTRHRAGIPPAALVHYAGLLAQRPRSAESLRNVVADYYGVPTRVVQLTGAWVTIPPPARSRLAAARGARLGDDLVLGDRYFDPAYEFRLRLGPMGLSKLLGLLPRTAGAESLIRFVRFAVGAEFHFDYTLTLTAREVPPARLTSDPAEPQRLGWTFWLRSHDAPRDAVSGPFRADAAEFGRR